MPNNNNIHKPKVLGKKPRVHNQGKHHKFVRRDAKGTQMVTKVTSKKRALKNSRNADYMTSMLGEINVEAIEAVGSRKRAQVFAKIAQDTRVNDDSDSDGMEDDESKTQTKRRHAREELARITSTQNPVKLALAEDANATEIAFQSGSKGTVLGAPLAAQ